MPYANKEGYNAFYRRRTKRYNARGLDSHGKPLKTNLVREGVISSKDLEKKMIEYFKEKGWD